MVITHDALDRFVQDLESLVETKPDEATLFDRGSVLLEKLVLTPGWLPEEFQRPSGRGRMPNLGVYNLHRGPSIYVSALVWGSGAYMGAHDHGTWGLIGVIDNGIQETRYRRLDDGERPGYAVLEQDRTALVKRGEVSVLIPKVDEIHRMENLSSRPTVEIHVYGKDLVGLPRHFYNVETGEIKDFASGPSDNC